MNIDGLERWHFELTESACNTLLDLVLQGKKRATSSSLAGYQLSGEEPPKEGDLSVITDWDGNPRCVIRTVRVTRLPYKDISFDLARREGGEPANFLDVGGDSTVDKIAEAFRIMQSDDQVHSVFVNIFGGINKCDVIAAGIVEAAKVVGLRVPVIARLDGTNVDEGRRILREANVPGVHMAKNMVEGAKLAVELAKEKKLQARIKG